MKEKCSIVRMFGMFDWRKGALCLLSVAAMGSAGSAGDWTQAVVPEPSSAVLLLIGFAGLALRRKKFKQDVLI